MDNKIKTIKIKTSDVKIKIKGDNLDDPNLNIIIKLINNDETTKIQIKGVQIK